MSNRLVLNETSYHGKGAIQEIAGEVKRRGFKKAFVCSGPTIYKHGVTKKVTDVLDQAGCAYEVYTNIKENPTIENVQNGVEAYKNRSLQFLQPQVPQQRLPLTMSSLTWRRNGNLYV